MIILIALAVLVGVCMILYKVFDCFEWLMGATLFALILCACLLLLPANFYGTKSNIARFIATEQTLEAARKQGDVLENATLQQKVIEQNQWLASMQYYESTVWGFWIPNEIMKLKPIK